MGQGEEVMTAIEILDDGDYSCVVVKNNELKHAACGRGIRPLLNLYKENAGDLEGSCVADKIIGKAAASVLICAKIKEAYGKCMSRRGLELLEQHGIKAEYGTLVEEIHNMTGTDMCPMENLVKDIDNLEDAVATLIEFLK